ncbi:4Fe-4S binding protein [Persephonella atlantica]|uniref:4Fe-4S binding protein n=1 Tax=Persephonella atlantica TaxID=2699429 RepID=A0ABS1GFF5_9AQUI|nr:4Fe-4S binding protein [Persephonella atlantica]MBK3331644.1 4Fe-4S binding protein [Persephonella atlantica]
MSTQVETAQACPQPSYWETHKFTVMRNLVYILVILALIVIPVFKIAKIDLAHDEAWIFWKKVPVEDGLMPVILALGFFAILVIVMNLFNGRVFCGWICPGGWVAELQDKLRRKMYHSRSSTVGKISYYLVSLVVAVLFLALFFNWVTDLRVFFYTTNPMFGWMWFAFLSALVVVYFEVFIGKRWCRTFCPTGIYQKITPYHHKFKTTMAPQFNLSDCGSCRECIKNCPMALDPRRMAYINDFYKGIQACIVCGECVDTCKQVRLSECKEPLMTWVTELPERDPDFVSGKVSK